MRLGSVLIVKKLALGMKEGELCTHRWDRVATGRRHPSLHMDVRFLACPIDEYTTHSPLRTYYKLSKPVSRWTQGFAARNSFALAR